MEKAAEFSRRLSGAGFENATQVALIRETGLACNNGEI